jgi:hypothetical protein
VVADLNLTADALVTLANIVHHPPDLFDPLAARHHVENKAGHHLLARVLQAVFSPLSAAWFCRVNGRFDKDNDALTERACQANSPSAQTSSDDVFTRPRLEAVIRLKAA